MIRRTFWRLVNFEAVFMPALSPSMETGVIVEWKKKVGDMVKENDVFCTIQTDKAVVDYTNTFDPGYLAKIYCQNGQSAPVAATIAVMVDDAADVAKADEYEPEGTTGAPAAADTPAVASASSSQPVSGSTVSGSSSEPPADVAVEAVFMPALSPSMETGVIVEWKKKVGDMVKENDVFCTIQTDKAVVDYTNTFDPGYLAKIYCQNGQSAPVAATIAVMVDDAADVAKVENYYPEGTAGAPAAADTPAVASGSVKRYGRTLDEAITASGPSVVRIAAGLDTAVLESITPTGKDGRFVKSDFAGQPGFDYNDATPAEALAPSSPSSATAKPAAPAPKAVASQTGVYDVVLTPGIVKKVVDDSRVLKQLLSTMPIPKPKKSAKN